MYDFITAGSRTAIILVFNYIKLSNISFNHFSCNKTFFLQFHHNRLENCRAAMMLAKQHFDIPLVVRPEDLSSSDLDELSGMTYLSYFMKLDSPGYDMTLTLVKRIMRNNNIHNFTVSLYSFNKTKTAVFPCWLCFLRAFPFLSLINQAGESDSYVVV